MKNPIESIEYPPCTIRPIILAKQKLCIAALLLSSSMLARPIANLPAYANMSDPTAPGRILASTLLATIHERAKLISTEGVLNDAFGYSVYLWKVMRRGSRDMKVTRVR